MCVVNSFEADILNKRIEDVKRRVEKAASEALNINKGDFSFVDFDRLFGRGSDRDMSFIDYVAKRIEERSDIQESTKKAQRKCLTMLDNFGKIRYFQDLTKANIMDFDNYLRKLGLKQTTIWDYHKINKIYINDAIARAIISSSP